MFRRGWALWLIQENMLSSVLQSVLLAINIESIKYYI